MEYNIIIAPSLEVLASEVAAYFSKGWRLKGGIVEHNDGFAQQLVRNPADDLRVQRKRTTHKRTKWIEA